MNKEQPRKLTKTNGDIDTAELSAAEMTQSALLGGAFDWLKDEPDLYTDNDGEAIPQSSSTCHSVRTFPRA